GAATTFAFLETAPTSQSLREAAKGVGGPAIRHKATLGGNLVAARFDGDGCVAVLAMPTIVEVASLERGTRQVQIDEFFKEKEGLTSLLPDELLTRIIIPANWRTGWYEIGKREGASHSIICCAIGISPQGDVRIALGGAGPSVCRSKAAEDQIKRDGLNPAAIATAAQAVITEVSPESNLHASANYRRAMCGVMVKRVLNELLDRRPSK
ncbi:MAG: FAD binding domain-containing protein, partial [Planctomycetota bacterium]